MSLFKKIASRIELACTNGLKFPFAYDPTEKKPSITLLTYYIALYMAIGSLIWIHFRPESLIPTSLTILFWTLSYIFYRIRKLDKAKVSLEDKSIELESKEEKTN